MGLDFSGVPAQVVTDRQVMLPASVAALGAFDGVHRGHQALIRAAVDSAREQGRPAVVWTFDPPPKVHFGRAAQLLPLAEKLARIAALGPDFIVVAQFNDCYARRSADDFLADLGRIGPVQIHVGADFRFGARQAGDVTLLARHFSVVEAPVTCCTAGETISSSRIRGLQASGRAAEAVPLLAAPLPLHAIGAALLTNDIRHREDDNA